MFYAAKKVLIIYCSLVVGFEAAGIVFFKLKQRLPTEDMSWINII